MDNGGTGYDTRSEANSGRVYSPYSPHTWMSISNPQRHLAVAMRRLPLRQPVTSSFVHQSSFRKQEKSFGMASGHLLPSLKALTARPLLFGRSAGLL